MQKANIVIRSLCGVWHWIVWRGDDVVIVGKVADYRLEEIVWALIAGV